MAFPQHNPLKKKKMNARRPFSSRTWTASRRKTFVLCSIQLVLKSRRQTHNSNAEMRARVDCFKVQDSLAYVTRGHTKDFISWTFNVRHISFAFQMFVNCFTTFRDIPIWRRTASQLKHVYKSKIPDLP